ncbi:MAG TPA: metal-binding protein [Pirellulales bacterium]|nr:metal-binding protein [Pirellulales bacterium]
MNVTFRYSGHSALVASGAGQELKLAANLARDAVAFDAGLKNPLRFREAISTLHDVVISDLKFKPRDKSAYEAWKKDQQQREAMIHRDAYQRAKKEILERQEVAVPPDFEKHYVRCRQRYWNARQKYSNYLLRHDQELWRLLMPCDPVITVADDVVFFECFSADESSYGCLTANRDDCFGTSVNSQYGTTNVDYSWQLYHHFQKLRTYRDTRFRVDPTGFELATTGQADYREEKIDLPAGWLRGFMQIQSAMSLPMRRLSLGREAVYSLLAWLKRHKAQKSPRALRFELLSGKPISLILEPWEQRIVAHGNIYRGPDSEPIRVWGRQRLLVLARLLPLVERIDVYLLSTGLPSFWVAQLGDMRLTLGLSGWTTNDWTRGSALDLLAPPALPSQDAIGRVAEAIREQRALSLDQVEGKSLTSKATCAAALSHLAHTGQIIYDLDARLYRWRQVMPRALGEAELGPDNEELRASRLLVARRSVKVRSRQELGGGLRQIQGEVESRPVELLLDADGAIKRGKCTCSHHFKGGLRMGPCRHLLALRSAASEAELPTDAAPDAWFERLLRWSAN